MLKISNLSPGTLVIFLQLSGIMAAPTVESRCQEEISPEKRLLVTYFLTDLKIKFATLMQSAKEVENEYEKARRLTNKAIKAMIKDNSPRESSSRFTTINVTEMLMEDHEQFETMLHSLKLRVKMERSDLIRKKMRTTLSILQGVLQDIRICISILRAGVSLRTSPATEKTRFLDNSNNQIRYFLDYILLNNLLRQSEIVIQKYTEITNVKLCI